MKRERRSNPAVLILIWMVMLMTTGSFAATEDARSTEPIELWPDSAPGALGKADTDIPTLTPFLADAKIATGAAVVICPGGGYHALMTSFEGEHYARWLNEMGVHGFVLKYRLSSGGYHHPAMMQDATRAMRLVRSRAGEWGVDPKRVGIMGSSAGGHLASTIMTHFDKGDAQSTDVVERQSSRPDMGILCYAVITLDPAKTNVISMENLLGKNPPEELRKLFSNEQHVTSDTPPCFLFHTADDSIVRVENSIMFAEACAKARVPFSLHIYPSGPHGLALGSHEWNPAARHPWTFECARWLEEIGFAR